MELVQLAATDKLAIDNNSALIEQATRSVKWSILYNTIPRLVTPFSTMILAALLTPSDFGLVAISTFVIALGRVVVELGLGKTVIQRQENVNEAASIGLWMSLLVAGGLYWILWITAPTFAAAYHTDQVTGVIRVSALALPLNALWTIPKALLQRNMEFSRLFWVNISFLIIQAIVSVALAILGFGYWSIIWGQLIGMTSSVGLAWGLSQWRPTAYLNWHILRSMLEFSIWVMVSGFQSWAFLYADNVIAGLFLGVHGLGVYALGFNFATVIPTFLVASLADVAYPAFCKIQEDHRRIGLSLVRLQMLAIAILMPMALGLSVIASPFIRLLYGNKWGELGMVIGILAIMPGLSPLWSALNENAYQAIGRPDISTKLSGISLLVLIPLLYWSAPLGLFIFVVMRFIGALFLPLGNIFIGIRSLDISVKEQLTAYITPVSLSLMMAGIVFAMTRGLSPFEGTLGWAKLLEVILIGVGSYGLLTWIFARDLWNSLVLYVHRVFS